MLSQSICKTPLVDEHEALSRLRQPDERDGWHAPLTGAVYDASVVNLFD